MELFNENSRLVAVIHKDYTLLPVINRLGIKLGFGDLTIKQLCETQNVDINFFVDIINVFHNEIYFPEKRLIDFSVTLVIDYLLKTHQYFLNYFIPENDRLIELFLSKWSSDHNEKDLIRKFYLSYKDEFIIHINFEEREVFPYILHLNSAIEGHSDKKEFIKKYKDQSIAKYEKEHTNIDDKMFDLKNIIIKYLPPNYDLNVGNALISNLFLFEKDLKNHARIEDKILVPKVKQLEKIVWKKP
jgi:regulator of cell morphogenesis and NO signaling